MGELAIGLYFDTFFMSPFLKISVTTADLSCSRNVPVAKQQFAIEDITGERIFLRDFIKLHGRLKPVLVFLSLLITFVYSSTDTG